MKKLSIILAGAALGTGLAAATPATAHWDGPRHDGWNHHRHHHQRHYHHRSYRPHYPHYYGHGYRTPPRVVYVPIPPYYNGYGNW